MWLFLSDSFLSIVSHPTKPSMLLVRARAAGDIEQVFPRAIVRHTPKRDYIYRANIQRNEVADAIAAEVRGISYPNFKNSVPDEERHDAYSKCWSAMYQWGRWMLDPWPAAPVPDLERLIT